MRAHPMTIRRASVAMFTLLACGVVLADDDVSITRKLIEADGKVALQKLEQDLAKTAPAPTLTAAPAGAKDQQQGDFGSGLTQDFRRVGDGDPAFPGSVEVAMINADGEIRDNFDAGGQAGDNLGS